MSTTKFVIDIDALVFAKTMRYIDHSGRTLEEILLNFVVYIIDDEEFYYPDWENVVTGLRIKKYAKFGLDVSTYQSLNPEDVVIDDHMMELLKKVSLENNWSIDDSIENYQSFVTKDFKDPFGDYIPSEIVAVMKSRKQPVFRKKDLKGNVKYTFEIDSDILEKARQYIAPSKTVLEELVAEYVGVISTHYLEPHREYKNIVGEGMYKKYIRLGLNEAPPQKLHFK